MMEQSAAVDKIAWTNQQRKLSELHPWPINPRQIKGKQAERLAQSMDEFGQVDILAIGPNNEVYNGHQRLNVLMENEGPDFVVDVRVSSRELSEQERKKLTVFLHQGATGEWDFDLLANHFEIDDLLDWGFEGYQLGIQQDIDYDQLWEGMPEFEQDDKSPFKSIKIHFRNQEDIDKFSDLIDCKITDKTIYIWFPYKKPEDLKKYKVINES